MSTRSTRSKARNILGHGGWGVVRDELLAEGNSEDNSGSRGRQLPTRFTASLRR